MIVATLAAVTVAAGAAYATTSGGGPTSHSASARVVSTCVSGVNGDLYLGRCRRGDRKLTLGVRGPKGKTGPAGKTGTPGTNGQGVQGDVGAAGPPGVQGIKGDTGAAGSSAFAYVYNEAAEVVPIEASVAFDTNGPLLGITHAPGDAGIVVTNSGTYKVTFVVSSVEPNEMALFVNGAPAAGTVYGSGSGDQQNTGQVILTLSAGDVLTLVNHSSAAAVTLQTLAGGTQTNVNASVAIERLA